MPNQPKFPKEKVANLLGAVKAPASLVPGEPARRPPAPAVGGLSGSGRAAGWWTALPFPRPDFAARAGAAGPEAARGGLPVAGARAGAAGRSAAELPTRRFADAQAALTALLQRAQTLAEAGVAARLPVRGYLEALGSVLRFIAGHPVLHGEVNLGAEMCGAVLRVAQELEGRPPAAPGLAEPLAVPPPLTVQHEEAIRTGVLLLAAYRQAVRPALRGARAAALRTEFGVDGEVTSRDGARVAAEIARFLHAAERYPEVLGEAGLSGAQLLGLMAQERVLRALAERRCSESTAAGSAYRAQVLHLALESFFDRYCAALLVRLLAQPEEQLRGLALAPRSAARRSGRPLADYAACQVTDSGRLVF